MQALIRSTASSVTDSVHRAADGAADRARASADAATEAAKAAVRDANHMAEVAVEMADAAAALTADLANKGARVAIDAAEDGFKTSEAQIAAYVASRPKPAGPFAAYIRLGDLAYTLTICAPFEFTVYFFITVSCLYAGASTYTELASAPWMSTLDIVLAIVFLTETAVKLVAEGTHPWKFFYGNPFWGWNCFDFASKPPRATTSLLCVHSRSRPSRSTALLS